MRQESQGAGNEWGILAGARLAAVPCARRGIVGFGRIGKATARKLQAFYAHVIAYDPSFSADLRQVRGKRPPGASGAVRRFSTRWSCMPPSTEETVTHQSEVSRRPTGAFLVNTARGRLVDPNPRWRGPLTKYTWAASPPMCSHPRNPTTTVAREAA